VLAERAIWVTRATLDTLVRRAASYLRATCLLAHRPDLEAFFVANIKSQLKRIKTNEKARQRNKAVKSSLKTSIRRFRAAAEAGDNAKALEALKTATRELDKAASKGVIHANQAANKKSAMAKQAAGL
jgi:small subunit ribosomal protein S20